MFVASHKHEHLEVSSAREAIFAFRMSLPWLKNLSTAALEGTGVVNLTKSLERTFSPMKAPSPRSTLDGPASKVLTDFTAFVLKT
jgi:hypothetical protein